MFSVFQLPQVSIKDKGVNSPRIASVLLSGKDYLVAMGLSVLILIIVMRLWHFDMNIPYCYYGGDELPVGVWCKTIYEEGWYLQSPRLGAPYGLHMGDYPIADGFHQLIYKILGWLSPNYVFALNLFFFLTFPLTTASSLFVLKRFGMNTPAATVSSLLFSFLPYKFFRSISHLYLSSYYIVPLSVLAILWIYLDRIAVFAPKSDLTPQERLSRRWRWLGSLVICAVQGASGVYYAFFACYLLLVAGAASALTRKKLYPIYTAIILVAITCGTLVVNLSPHILYRWQHGKNPEVAVRTMNDAEVHGLKISYLLLPVPNHRFAPLAELTEYYRNHSLPGGYGESQWSAFGAVGGVGLLVLLITLLKQRTSKDDLVNSLAKLNVWAILLGTIGGFSSLFALLVSPMIRGYNRISIFVAFFSFFMVCVILNRVGQYLSQRGWPARWGYVCLLFIMLVVGVADQVPSNVVPLAGTFVPQYQQSRGWVVDAKFFGEVEASLPGNSAVMQLPHMTFPECEHVYGVGTYDNSRGFLHTNRLRWSYPMRGRRSDTLLSQVLTKPIDEQVQELAILGFVGIYIDRRGYPDRARQLEMELARILCEQPIISDCQTMSFWSMVDYSTNLKDSMTTAQWDMKNQLIRSQPLTKFGKGFYALEGTPLDSWRWCQNTAVLDLENPTSEPMEVEIQFQCKTGQVKETNVSIESPLLSTSFATSSHGTSVRKTLTLPPGRHSIHFSTDTPPFDATPDPRNLVFMVRNFYVTRKKSVGYCFDSASSARTNFGFSDSNPR